MDDLEAPTKLDNRIPRSKRIFRFTLVTLLFVVIFVPHSLTWQDWKPWALQYVYALLLIALCAVALAVPCIRRGMTLIGKTVQSVRRLPDTVFIGEMAFLCFAFCFYLSGILFDHLPTEMDGMAQYAGAKILAHGHFYLHSHPLRRFFDTYWFINDGKFYVMYPPGHLLLLALGHLIGRPEIIDPMMGALGLISTYYLAKEIGNASTGKIAVLLFLYSPFLIFMSSEFESHPTALLATTLFVLFYIRMIKTRHWKNGLFSGIAMGYLFITRPQVAIPYGLPFAIHGVKLLFSQRRTYGRLYFLWCAGALPFVLFFLYYNWQTNGNPFITGLTKVQGNQIIPGVMFLAKNRWKEWSVNFMRVVTLGQWLTRQLFGWPISSLLPAYALFATNSQKPFCRLLAGSFYCTFFMLMLTTCSYAGGQYFGPRYLYETSSALIIFTALLIQRLPGLCRNTLNFRAPLNVWRGVLFAGLSMLTIVAIGTTDKALFKIYGNNYRSGNLTFYHSILKSVKAPALVLLPIPFYNHIVFTQPNDHAAVIFAHDLGKQDQLILNYYPHRHAYLVRKNGSLQALP